jgi:ubiquinone/menaquinone biosynthesis C-methylase UbiE
MSTPDDAKQKAASTYDAASDFYDHPTNTFWERYGRRTVERLALSPGARVLDVCCGSGASALPAAETVGPGGSVLGVDLAENLLALARRKAENRGLDNVAFRVADMLDLHLPPESFDAVICVFGIFFVPDMQRAAHELWSFVRPGGQLAVTTWGPRFFEPVNSVFWASVGALRPELSRHFNPWDRISEPAALREILASAGVQQLDVTAEPGKQQLASPEDWWPMVLGTGYRGTMEQLDTKARDRVRSDCLNFIIATCVNAVEANVVYAIGRK